MKSRILIILLVIGFSFFTNAQSEVDEDEMVGFACSVGGSYSKSVNKVTKLLYNEKYNKIRKLLFSDNTAEQFLSVVLVEDLNSRRLITITKSELNRIAEIYESKSLVSVCSGCTYYDKVELRELMNKENQNPIREDLDYWLESITNYLFESKK